MGAGHMDLQRIKDGLQRLEQGLLDGAAEAFQQVLNADPLHAPAWHLLGLVAYQRGEYAQAVEKIERAIAIDNSQAVFWNNSGAALQALQSWEEALHHFEKAIALRHNYADALANLGHLHAQRERAVEAEKWLRRCLRYAPQHFDGLRHLAKLLSQQRKFQEAADLYSRALDVRPDDINLRDEVGNFCLAQKRGAEAVEHYQHVLAVQPSRAYTRFNLSGALAEQELWDESRAHLNLACELPDAQSEWRLRLLTICPSTFPSVDALEGYRNALDAELDRQIDTARPMEAEALRQVGYFPPFALAFQGRENRQLKEKFAALTRKLLATEPHSPPCRKGKPRVGIVVTRGHEGNFLRNFGGILQRLNPDLFDVVLIGSRWSARKLQRDVAREQMEVVGIPDDIPGACDTIRAAACDVLYYWEIGSDALNYLLPFHRLAPIQCTSWSTQVTSGMHEVDYYLSSELIEAPGSERYYTERLWKFAGLLTCQGRVPTPPPTSKAHFGLDGYNVYHCPQTILKLHPEQDALFAAVLRKDPRGVLTLVVGRKPRPAEVLRERMRRSMPDVFDRIRFIPWQAQEDFYGLISIADAVLDTQHFNSTSSSYDMWSLNQPLITLPGQFHLGRYTLGCYRKMEMLDFVATDVEHYAELSYRLSNDREWREVIMAKLAECAPVLFGELQAVREFEDFFCTKIAELRLC